MKKIKSSHLLAFVFFAMLLAGTVINIKLLPEILLRYTKGDLPEGPFHSVIDSELKTNISGRDVCSDLYGLLLNTLGRKQEGSLKYLKDKDQILYYVYSLDSQEENQRLVDNITALDTAAKNAQVPFLYVQLPPRATSSDRLYGEYEPNTEARCVADWKLKLLDNKIDYLEAGPALLEACSSQPEELWFKTDDHMTTASELALLQILVEDLENRYGLEFQQKDVVLDPEHYITDSRQMVGNLGRYLGRYYVGEDTFDMLIPTFTTQLHRYIPGGQTISRGSFTESLLNGDEKDPDANHSTYWVVNYGMYEEPLYAMDNELVKDGPRILFLMDSNGMRTVSYLSLMCSNITVLDPRRDGGAQAMADALETLDSYDAVVMLQRTSYLTYGFMENLS